MSAMTTMNATKIAEMPEELLRLRARIELLPQALRDELEPLADDAIEDAIFRGRVLNVAKNALERFKLDLALTRFDLEATRIEREDLRHRMGSLEV